jgi:hypothetical protein
MFNFLLLFLVPLLIATVAMFYFRGKVTILEFVTQNAIVALFLVICLALAHISKTSDVEIWNGKVIGKQRVVVPCSHSYPCRCREECTGSGQSRSCTQVCDTCYLHPYDVDWDVQASTNESVSIDRIDSQGLDMPPRWAAAYAGEPFASRHRFENYIKANPESVLFGTKGDVERYKKWIPAYPATIYDYYYHDPVINMGVPNIDLRTWNWLIREVNKELGPSKQVNVIVIFVPTSEREYMLAFKDAWLGGKKNDVDIVIGSTDGHEIAWADVMSWSPSGQFKVDIKNRIQEIGTLDHRDDIKTVIFDTTKNEFVRLHMKDMRYLMRSFQPSRTAMLIFFILGILIQIGITIRVVSNDITDDDPKWINDYGEFKG